MGNQLEVTYENGRGKGDVIVFANEHESKRLDPFLNHAIFSVRHQFLAFDREQTTAQWTGKAQFGHFRFQDSRDARIVSGCRWATPHLETGENDANVINPQVKSTLERIAKQRFPELINKRITGQWAAIGSTTCDGIPLIGPIPGRQDLLICAGFGEETTTLGLRGAESIARLLIDGKDDQLPSFFKPRRLLQ